MAIATLTVALQAQIAEFQADFKKAAKSTEEFQKDFEKTATKASAYGNLIATGVQLGIEAFGNLGAAVLENASNIKDLSHKTGLAMGTIQEFQHVAESTGSTVGAFADAAFRLGINIAGGSNSVVNALDALGLSFEELKRLSPDAQFKQITTALGEMDNQQERNRLGVILFDRTFKGIAASVDEGYAKLAAGAKKAADGQIVALSDAENAWKDFKRNALTSATSFAGEAVLQYRLVDSALKDMGGRFNEVAALLPGNTTGLLEYADALRRVQQRANEIDLSRVVGEMQQDALKFLTLGDRTGGATILQPGTADYRAVEAELDASIKRQNTIWDKAKAAADAYRDSIIQLRDEFSGAKLGAEVKKMEDAFRLLTDEQRKSPDVQDRVGEAAERLRQDGANLSPELQTLAVRTQAFSEWLNKVPGQTDRWATSFDTLRTALEKPLVQLQGIDAAIAQIDLSKIGNEVNFGEQGFDRFENTIPWETQFKIGVTVTGKEVLQDLVGLINDVGDAIGGLPGEFLKASAKIVGSLTSVGQAWDKLVAQEKAGQKVSIAQLTQFTIASAGLVLTYVQTVKNILERDSLTAKMVRDFEELHGGFRRLMTEAQLAGVSLDRLYDTDSASEFRREVERVEAAIRAQDEAMKRYDLTWRDFNQTVRQSQINQTVRDLTTDFRNLVAAGADPTRVIQGMSGALNQFILDAINTGIQIPHAMRPMIEAMIRARLVTEDVARAMLGMAADTMPSLADIKEAADRYGLSLDALGPKVQQLRITETALQIVKDFDLLILAGADVATVLGGMQVSVQGLVTRALTLGLALPESMRPLLEAMVRLGLLTDENGIKLEDLGRIKFEESLVGAIDRLIEALGFLIDEMNDVGSAADIMWTRVRGDNPVTGTAIPRGTPPPPPTTPTPPPGAPSGTTPPPLPPGSRTPPSSTMTADPGSMTISFDLDGNQIATATVPYLPGAIRRYVPA